MTMTNPPQYLFCTDRVSPASGSSTLSPLAPPTNTAKRSRRIFAIVLAWLQLCSSTNNLDNCTPSECTATNLVSKSRPTCTFSPYRKLWGIVVYSRLGAVQPPLSSNSYELMPIGAYLVNMGFLFRHISSTFLLTSGHGKYLASFQHSSLLIHVWYETPGSTRVMYVPYKTNDIPHISSMIFWW